MSSEEKVGPKSLFRWSRLAAVASSVAAYLPIVAGIIEPMIWPLLIASPLLYHLLYWWWEPMAQHLFPAWWFFTSYVSGTRWVNALAPYTIAVGAFILLGGLAQIVRARARGTGLVTTGLYGYVRHPQHLGIAIISLGLLMMNGYGVRVGDVYAWTLVAFMYVLQAEDEEEALEKEHGERYLSYKGRVPYMLPFIPPTRGRFRRILPEHGWRRRLALTAAYALTLAALTLLMGMVPTFHTR